MAGALSSARQVLAEVVALVGDAQEAGRILAHALDVPYASLAVELRSGVPAAARARALGMAARRAGGAPLQHVLGSWGFRRLDVAVDRRALVPRPETEQLVEVALEQLVATVGVAGEALGNPVVVDLGTGTGVIALSLALEGPPGIEVWATERSPEALELARCNLGRLAEADAAAAARVHLCPGSWFEPLPAALRGRVAVVVSNPPYVSEAEWSELDPVVRDHDPRSALVPGPTGLEALAAVVDGSMSWLAPGAALVVELAPWQADEVGARASGRGYVDVQVRVDLAGRRRFVVAHRPGT